MSDTADAVDATLTETPAERMRRYRAQSSRVRVEIQARNKTEALAIRQFVQHIRSRPAAQPQEQTTALDRTDLVQQWELTPTARASVEQFGAALHDAAPTIIERGARMAEALSDAARRVRETRAVIAAAPTEE